MKDSSLFNLSGIDPIVNYSGSDWASTNGSHKTSLPSPSPILRSDLDLFQSDTDAARTSAPDVRNYSLSGKKIFIFAFHQCSN